jgi:hypothetical protein
MQKQFIIIVLILFSALAGCKSEENKPDKVNTPDRAIAAPTENIISTEIEEGKNESEYISIFYSVTGLTPEGGEEITAHITKENGKDKISKLTFVHRKNTTIEPVELNDTKKIKAILTSLQSLKATDNRDKDNINMLIKLLKENK